MLKELDIPKWFFDEIDNQAKILKDLTNERGLSAYGYVDGLNKEHFKGTAISFKNSVKEIIKDCEQLIKGFSSKKRE